MRSRLYLIAGYLSATTLVVLTGTGIYYAFETEQRPPGIRIDYTDAINNKVVRNDYEGALSEIRMAAVLDSAQRVRMLEGMLKLGTTRHQIATQVEAYRLLTTCRDIIPTPAMQTDLAIALLEQHSQLPKGTIDRKLIHEARASCERALQLDPNFAAAAYVIAEAWRAEGDAGQADAAVRQALQLLAENGGDNDESMTRLLNRAGHAGDLSTHIVAFRRYLQNPYNKSPATCNDFASELLTLQFRRRDENEIRESIDWAKQAIDLKPDFAPAHCNVGAAQSLLNQHAEAAAAFRKALEIDPTLAPARQGLDYAEQQMAGSEKAKS